MRTVAPLCSLLLVLVLLKALPAQEARYWRVGLPDKDPHAFPALSPAALENRYRLNLAVTLEDLPVSAAKTAELVACPQLRVVGISRWLNSAFIQTTLAEAELRQRFPWIATLSTMPARLGGTSALPPIPNPETIAPNAIAGDYGFASVQTRQVGLDCLHDQGYTGKGVKIAVFDSGFRNVNQIPAFDSLFMQNRVLLAYDFVNQDQSIYDEDNHGTHVLSVMAARLPGMYTGSAWQGDFLLARTETIFSETTQEESNWLMAMEWADSLGARVIQASLGYNRFDGGLGYAYADLDGKTALISRAASFAAAKGMAVVVSAGNEGSNSWMYVTVPADADSILAVGSVDNSGDRSGFSSVGPTADGRIKPDVVAMGSSTAIISTSGSVSNSSGTSFAAPIIAGMAACLAQAHPNKAGWEIAQAIRLSADKASNPDNLYGYGIPNACRADSILRTATFLGRAVSAPAINLYPNPATDWVTISIADSTEFPLNLYDGQGRFLREIRESPFWIGDLPVGTYWLGVPMKQGELRFLQLAKGY